MKKIIKVIVLGIVALICIIAAVIAEIKDIPGVSMIGSLIAGIIIPIIIPCIVDLTDNTDWKSSYRKLMRAGILQDDSVIRISFAYLFRIKVDGKYLLVPNTRTHKYQPVGGTYKFDKKEARYLAQNIPVENDDRIPVDKITKRDYRLLVKSKDLKRFMNRFNETVDRENYMDLSREFVEELFNTGILKKETFGNISYRFCGRHITPVEYGEVFKHYELLLADIVELELTNKQEEQLRCLMNISSPKYKFATADEIKSLGVHYHTNELADDIANHSYKILSETSDKLENVKGYEKKITIEF